MTFVNELIPAEQKSNFDLNVFHQPECSWHRPITTSHWTIDRERDVFIISLGGGGQWEGGDAPKPPEYLALSWEGKVIKFEAVYSETGRYLDGNLVGYWDVMEIHLPPEWETRRNAVQELIRSGLGVMGDPSCVRERLTKVSIDFHQQTQKSDEMGTEPNSGIRG